MTDITAAIALVNNTIDQLDVQLAEDAEQLDPAQSSDQPLIAQIAESRSALDEARSALAIGEYQDAVALLQGVNTDPVADAATVAHQRLRGAL